VELPDRGRSFLNLQSRLSTTKPHCGSGRSETDCHDSNCADPGARVQSRYRTKMIRYLRRARVAFRWWNRARSPGGRVTTG